MCTFSVGGWGDNRDGVSPTGVHLAAAGVGVSGKYSPLPFSFCMQRTSIPSPLPPCPSPHPHPRTGLHAVHPGPFPPPPPLPRPVHSAPPPARTWRHCRRTAAAGGPSPTWATPSALWCRCEPVCVDQLYVWACVLGGRKPGEHQLSEECYCRTEVADCPVPLGCIHTSGLRSYLWAAFIPAS